MTYLYAGKRSRLEVIPTRLFQEQPWGFARWQPFHQVICSKILPRCYCNFRCLLIFQQCLDVLNSLLECQMKLSWCIKDDKLKLPWTCFAIGCCEQFRYFKSARVGRLAMVLQSSTVSNGRYFMHTRAQCQVGLMVAVEHPNTAVCHSAVSIESHSKWHESHWNQMKPPWQINLLQLAGVPSFNRWFQLPRC